MRCNLLDSFFIEKIQIFVLLSCQGVGVGKMIPSHSPHKCQGEQVLSLAPPPTIMASGMSFCRNSSQRIAPLLKFDLCSPKSLLAQTKTGWGVRATRVCTSRILSSPTTKNCLN